MEENINVTTREELKKYFETGDHPTEAQFAKLIDSYAHLNEFNFGLSVNPSGYTLTKYYHFYKATDVMNSGAGHKIIEDPTGGLAQEIPDYEHVLSRNVSYKHLSVTLKGAVTDLSKYKPKLIIERYRQRKKIGRNVYKSSGYRKEEQRDAVLWNRKSEYDLTGRETTIEIEPIYYFRPGLVGDDYKGFVPSGSFRRDGSYRYTGHRKAFEAIQVMAQIEINGKTYLSAPVSLRIVLGSSGETDAINFVFN